MVVKDPKLNGFESETTNLDLAKTPYISALGPKSISQSSIKNFRINRTQSLLELRKQKNSKLILKKRNLTTSNLHDSSPCYNQQPQIVSSELMQIKQLLDDGSQLGLGVDLLRRFLSRRPTSVELQAIVQLGFVDFMIESLDHIQDSQIIYDICWGITNLSSGTHEMCAYIVARGVIEKLSRVIDSTDSRVTNQSIWALSNLATDCFEFRHKILELTVVDSLMSFLAQNQDNSKYLQNLAWFLSNIFRPNSKQNVDQGLIRKFLPLLFNVVQLNNLAARKDSALAICHIAQTGYENIELIIKYQLHEFMFNIAYNSNNTEFLMPVLRFFGSMSFSSDEHTQILLEKDIKVLLIKTLNSKCPELIRDSLWIMSNMAAGTIEQIDYIFDLELIRENVLNHLDNDSHLKSKIVIEIFYFLHNILVTHCGKSAVSLLNNNVTFLEHMRELLTSPNAEMISIALQVLFYVLRITTDYSPYSLEDLLLSIEEKGILDLLESLQLHANQQIYQKSYEIAATFFSEEENQADNSKIVDQLDENNLNCGSFANGNERGRQISNSSLDKNLAEINNYTSNVIFNF